MNQNFRLYTTEQHHADLYPPEIHVYIKGQCNRYRTKTYPFVPEVFSITLPRKFDEL